MHMSSNHIPQLNISAIQFLYKSTKTSHLTSGKKKNKTKPKQQQNTTQEHHHHTTKKKTNPQLNKLK